MAASPAVQQAQGGRRLQRLHGGRGPQLRVPAGVLELEQLDQPFDVAQPAAAQLQVPGGIGAARQPLRLDPGLDPPDLPHVLLGQAPAG